MDLLKQQNLPFLLSTLAHQSDIVVWIRTPNYNQCLYVSPNFESIWGHPPEIIFDDPLTWTTFLVQDDRTEKILELCQRMPKIMYKTT